jgi:hypothetical protein
MSSTVKYLLIGGGVAVAVYLVARNRLASPSTPGSTQSPLVDKINAFTGLVGSLDNLVGTVTKPDVTGPTATTADGTAYATRSTSPDGLVPSSLDASGYRTRRAYVNAPETTTVSQLALIGVHRLT